MEKKENAREMKVFTRNAHASRNEIFVERE